MARWMAAGLLAFALVLAATTHPASTSKGDAAIYVDAARSVASGRYQTSLEPSGVPRYPPGLPLLLAPGEKLNDGDVPAQVTSILLGMLLVALIWLCARELGGDIAASASMVLVLLCPAILHGGGEVMSDVPAAAAVLAGLLLLARGRARWAGFLFGVACFMRLTAVVYLAALRRRALAVAALVVLALVAFQLHVHGNLAGYQDPHPFSLRYLLGGTTLEQQGNPSPLPNVLFYPEALLGAAPGFVVMLVLPFLGGLGLWLRRNERVARTALWVCVSTMATYLVYYFQSVRFMLPIVAVLIVYGGVAVSDLVRVPAGSPAANDRQVSLQSSS